MEFPKCDTHQTHCLRKTGVKDGPNYGKSFYICAVSADRCDFVVEAPNAGIEHCDLHSGSVVELCTLRKVSHGEKRVYYRCTTGRKASITWCGYNLVGDKSQKHTKQPLNDVDVNVAARSKSATTISPSTSKNQRSPVEVAKTKVSPGSTHGDTKDRKREKSEGHTKTTSKQASPGSTHDDTKDRKREKSEAHAKTTSKHGEPQKVTSQPTPQTSTPKPKGADSSKKPVSDFASLSLQNRLKEFTIEGNESLLVSPRSGQLKYRSQIGKHDDDSDSDSIESTHSDNETDDDDCKIVAVESPKPGIQRPTIESRNPSSVHAQTSSTQGKTSPREKPSAVMKPQGAGAVATSTQQGAQQKVLTFKNKEEMEEYLKNQRGQVKVVKVVNPGDGKVVLADLQRNTREKETLMRRRDQQMEIMKKINRKTLPDGGAKLDKQIADMTQQISQLDLAIQQGRKIAASLPPTTSLNAAAHTGSGGVTVSGQAVLPGTKQTLMTNHTVQLTPHQLQQMYAANPQMMTLYGGRMTAARLQEVGSVTTEAIEQLHKQLETMPGPDVETEDPRRLTVPLMIHQRQALSWLTWREMQQPAGGILADDMGLGKTLTMISLILKDKQARKKQAKADGKADEDGEDEDDEEWTSKEKQLKKLQKGLKQSNATLVVCPASLVHQWAKEIERRCSGHALRVELYHGTNREKDINVLARSDVVLTTYNLIGREVGAPPSAKSKSVTDMPVKDAEETDDGEACPGLLSVAWRRVILDEAHNIKNHKSLTAMSVCRLRAGRRWALTGTPIQNDLLDMYSLLRFLRCSPFDELKVWKRQVDNKSSNGQKRLNTLIKSLLLRRTKDQDNKKGEKLVPLPPKRIFTHDLTLSKGERSIYERIFQQSKNTLVDYLQRADEKQQLKSGGQQATPSSDNPWSGSDSMRPPASHSGAMPGASQGVGHAPGVSAGAGAGKTSGTQILLMLLRLRQCCSHLSLTKETLEAEALEKDDGIDLDIVEQMRLMAVDETKTEEPTATQEKKSSVFDPNTPSTKITEILKHLHEIRENSDKKKPQKSVIVSQWTGMLSIVEKHLKEDGFRCTIIKGDVAPKKRAELVDAFNGDPKGPEVMLLSLRAGGVGLNLIGGNHLFLMDMHWNPALESQACDRIYRVGQVRDVSIHRFICQDTIEEKILKLQQRKLELADNVLSGAKSSGNKLTLQDLKMLFGLDLPQQPLYPRPANFAPATSMWKK